jgi:2-polyprenyl-6-methoxyphenol hydroxylase-like FAD-dependent oxidoreductase
MSGGMQALRTIGLLDQTMDDGIAVLKHFSGQENGFRVWNADFSPLLTFKVPHQPPDGLPIHGMRITRYMLRQCLIDALPEGTDVKWEVGCEGAKRLEDGRVRVMLNDGTTDDCDLLVAADGANSKIRAALRPGDTLSYAGVKMTGAISKFDNGLPDIIQKNYGLVLTGEGSCLFVSPVSENTATWAMSWPAEKPMDRTIAGDEAFKKMGQILADAEKAGRNLASPWPELLANTDGSTLTVLNANDKMPIDHAEISDTQVIFLGDASHAVCVD